MAAETSGTRNQPHFSGAGVPADAADMTLISDYAATLGNRRSDLASVRAGLTGSDVWEGLEFRETDTFKTYVYTASSWVLTDTPVAAYTPTVSNVSTSAVVAKWSMSKRIVTATVKITVSAAPTGQPVITLPVNADTSGPTIVGRGVMKNGTSAWVEAFVHELTASTVTVLPLFTSVGSPTYMITSPSVTVDSTHPFAWASGHIIEATFTYPAA